MLKRLEHADSEIRQILGLLAILGIPAAITLYAVQPGPDFDPANPTPYGYTISLLLFVVPVVVMLSQLLWRPASTVHRRALFTAAGVMALVGFTLDIFFGESFFTFANRGATLEWHLPAWSFAKGQWVHGYLPLEEFAFYILGGLFLLTTYIWAEDRWLRDGESEGRARHAQQLPRLIQVHPHALVFWIGSIGAGFLFKRYVANEPGFPGYFLFIMVIGFLPTVLFLNAVKEFVNWRAFLLAFVVLLLVELLWEATLGVPFDWWNYKDAQMLSIRIAAWAHLPLEAILLWLVVAWDCIVAFEICRIFLLMDEHAPERRPLRHKLFGAPGAP